jgi:hypothetical protein
MRKKEAIYQTSSKNDVIYDWSNTVTVPHIEYPIVLAMWISVIVDCQIYSKKHKLHKLICQSKPEYSPR